MKSVFKKLCLTVLTGTLIFSSCSLKEEEKDAEALINQYITEASIEQIETEIQTSQITPESSTEEEFIWDYEDKVPEWHTYISTDYPALIKSSNGQVAETKGGREVSGDLEVYDISAGFYSADGFSSVLFPIDLYVPPIEDDMYYTITSADSTRTKNFETDLKLKTKNMTFSTSLESEDAGEFTVHASGKIEVKFDNPTSLSLYVNNRMFTSPWRNYKISGESAGLTFIPYPDKVEIFSQTPTEMDINLDRTTENNVINSIPINSEGITIYEENNNGVAVIVDNNQNELARKAIQCEVIFFLTGIRLEAPYKSKVERPADRKSEGRVFVGWYKDRDGTIPWDFDNDVVTSPRVYIYPKWEVDPGYKNTNLVVFSAEGKIVSFYEMERGDGLPSENLPAVPSKPGYEGFWNISPENFEIIMTDLSVLAQYYPEDTKPDIFNVKIEETPGGIAAGSGKYLSGAAAKLTASPIFECEFLGWYENNSLLSSDEIYTFKITGDRIIEARFHVPDELINGGTTTPPSSTTPPESSKPPVSSTPVSSTAPSESSKPPVSSTPASSTTPSESSKPPVSSTPPSSTAPSESSKPPVSSTPASSSTPATSFAPDNNNNASPSINPRWGAGGGRPSAAINGFDPEDIQVGQEEEPPQNVPADQNDDNIDEGDYNKNSQDPRTQENSDEKTRRNNQSERNPFTYAGIYGLGAVVVIAGILWLTRKKL